MRYRTPTQLHASLYMEEFLTAKKEKDGFGPGKDAKAKTKKMPKVTVTESIKKRK